MTSSYDGVLKADNAFGEHPRSVGESCWCGMWALRSSIREDPEYQPGILRNEMILTIINRAPALENGDGSTGDARRILQCRTVCAMFPSTQKRVVIALTVMDPMTGNSDHLSRHVPALVSHVAQ